VTKVFVETTVLTDALLKAGLLGAAARQSLKRASETLLPVYAIKEFKAGPLSYYVWLHNKFVSERKYSDVQNALHALSRTPQRYRLSTALEAMRDVEATMRTTLAALSEKYGAQADVDSVMRDRYRLALYAKIAKAWKQRRTVVSSTVCPLSCYVETEPKSGKNGLIDLNGTRCGPPRECCLAADFKARPSELRALMNSIEGSTRPEDQRRRKALRSLERTPKRTMTEEVCRALGDAVFALQCPRDAAVLTTNLRDHRPLAGALGKTALRPTDI